MLENIKEKIKKIKPLHWIMIVGGVGVAYFIFKPTQTYTAPAITTAGSGGTSQAGLSDGTSGNGMVAGSDSILTKIITDTQQGFDVLKEQNTSLKNSLTQIDKENNTLMDYIENLKSDYDKMKQQVNQVSNEYGNYVNNTNKAIDTVNSNYSKLQEEYSFESALNNLGSIYFNDKDDVDEYNTISKSIKSSVSSGGLTSNQGSSVLDKIAGLGNNGVGNSGASYSQEKTDTLLNSLKSDSSKQQSEIERANQVIKNRESQGLDTTSQKNYLKTITGL